MRDPSASAPSCTSKSSLRNAFIMTEASLLAQISSSVGWKNELGKWMAQISDIFSILGGLNERTQLQPAQMRLWLDGWLILEGGKLLQIQVSEFHTWNLKSASTLFNKSPIIFSVSLLSEESGTALRRKTRFKIHAMFTLEQHWTEWIVLRRLPQVGKHFPCQRPWDYRIIKVSFF